MKDGKSLLKGGLTEVARFTLSFRDGFRVVSIGRRIMLERLTLLFRAFYAFSGAIALLKAESPILSV
ncbi:MAG: hypothetical protein QXS66_01710 [Thermoproteota archaeon]|nr:hypothetical protein [Candidatus Brockarchaeota archaeon]